MPRVARALADEQIYDSINRGNRRDDIFHDEYDFTKMLNKVACPLYFNRLTNISYPDNPNNNVSYDYGSEPLFNNVGRITQIFDGSGNTLFEYGRLGETTKETRTVNSLKNGTPYTYTTRYRYDTWNRLRELTYPDGEILTHTYDSGGKLSTLTGTKEGNSYHYLQALTYDKFGQRVFAKYANGTTSTYSYEAERRRLSHLNTANETRTFIDNSYSYDAMQNILSITNAAAVLDGSADYGGAMSQNFTYDNLYQLTNAQGTWNEKSGAHQYSLAMTYDSIGNIKTKNQRDEYAKDSATFSVVPATTYNWLYEHAGTQPHAPTRIGKRIFSYDKNGNQTGWVNTDNGSTRIIRWDEENRIKSISDNGQSTEFAYDVKGDRTAKNGAGGETLYFNAYFVAAGSKQTKHIFAGSQRITSKMANGTVGAYEGEQYYFHPDHLGSSSFITDTAGDVYEHLEYFPYGETWGHQQSGSTTTPYKFTGKELDVETGLYYYGARYYDPRTSVWVSPDPILEEYMRGEGNGGVFNPKNLSLFSYTYNNPITLVDTDGNKVYYYGYVVMNPKVRSELNNLNSKIMEKTGLKNSDFTIVVIGGDRYKDSDGNIRSLTNNKIVSESAEDSSHQHEQGALAVDITIEKSTLSMEEQEDLVNETAFGEEGGYVYTKKTKIHANLPRTDKYKMAKGSKEKQTSSLLIASGKANALVDEDGGNQGHYQHMKNVKNLTGKKANEN